ncbi:MAG: SWF/SNF helicase family protein, partial [Prevotella sp.]|nr:SWF/SNF helicase family protein [Prevotella sp.]
FNLRTYTENMIKMWNNNTIFVCPQIDINKELDIEAKEKRRKKKVTFNDCIEDIRVKIEKLTKDGKNAKGQNAEYQREDFKEDYIKYLNEDLELINKLCYRWAMNTQDPKFDKFKECLKPELFDPLKNTSGKLVIFSEAIDTVDSLEHAVEHIGYKPLVVTSENRNELEHTIEENFDANYEGKWKDDYNVLISTEVLSEGVNLHRANVILNYDTPWNSTRLMQRIGRVNRIGSKEPNIYVYNFMPSDQGDSQIKLVRRAFTKLQSFHVLFGEDSKIFSQEEEVIHYDLQNVVNGEESPLQKYVHELKQYKETHAERYQQIKQAKDEWQIAQVLNGTAYFMLKAPQSARLYFRINQNEGNPDHAQIISLMDMLENLNVDENAKSVPLPDNWQQLSESAILSYNQYFVTINKSRAGDKRTKALEIINKLYNDPNLSKETKKLLTNARRLTDRGSYDIIKKIVAIGKELEDSENQFFVMDQGDINDILKLEIGNLVANVEKKQGKPQIILGTIK